MSKGSSSQLYQYQPDPGRSGTGALKIKGSHRLLELDGRKGINPTSIETLIEYPAHNLNEEKGTLTYWVFALEDVFTFMKRDVMFTEANKSPQLLSLLSDNSNIGNFSDANFLLTYEATWHPAFLAKFYRGDVFLDAIRAPQKAYAMASAFEMERNRWYQFTMTWDFEREEIFIYANGVRIACADRFHTAFKRDRIGDILYSGRPVYCFGELKFYDTVLSADEAIALYRNESTATDDGFQKLLRHTYAGENPEPFKFQPGPDWRNRLTLDLNKPEDLDQFRIQGIVKNTQITDEGLHIQTLEKPYEPQNRDQQMYLWTRDTFEGDLFVEIEFRPNQAFGLALLVFQASGMSREDIEKDYPGRNTGNMHWIHSSDMRNYHLEYFRRMTATRNDIDNVALIKNPYQWPMGFGCLDEPLKEHCWHKLQILHEEGRITAAVNGKICLKAEDHPFGNNGPVLNFGHVALRCMINTDLHFRNLRIANKDLPYREIQH